MDTELLEIFWETVKEYVPAKDRQVAADHVVTNLIDSGLDEETAMVLKALDSHMKDAVLDHFPEDEDETEDEDWE